MPRICVAAGVQQRRLAAVVYQETHTWYGSTFLLNRQVLIWLGRPCGSVELVLVVLVLCVGH